MEERPVEKTPEEGIPEVNVGEETMGGPAGVASQQETGTPGGDASRPETVQGCTGDNFTTKANVLNRVIARFIDILFALLLGRLPGLIGLFAALTYICIADGLMGGRSIGKRIIGLRVSNPGKGRIANFRDSIFRNSTIGLLYIISRVPILGAIVAAIGLGMELVLMVGSPEGKRLGDEIAGTIVSEYRQEYT